MTERSKEKRPSRQAEGAFQDESDANYTAPSASEIALAEEFAAEAKGLFRWTPGLDWMMNVGSNWERDTTLQRYTLAKEVCTQSAAELKGRAAIQICSAKTVNAVLVLARDIEGISTPSEQWDARPDLLNTPQGVINLKTGDLFWDASLLFTHVTEVAPKQEPTPIWNKFLADVFDGDPAMIEFIQRMAGYCLTGSTEEQKLFFLHGLGANGKSVFLDTLKGIAGTYAFSLPTDALMAQRHAPQHPTVYADLRGSRMAVSAEIEDSAHWAESLIKQLTGDEKYRARYMRQDFFEFKVTHKHLIAGNYKPRLRGDDAAMARRLVLIPFNQRFEGARRDKRLFEKLHDEWPGILHWAIVGATNWAQSGLAIPQSVADASAEYMAEQNDLELWIAECCQRDPAAITTATTAYESFAAWKERNGEHATSMKAFSQRLERLFIKKKTGTARVFRGLRVLVLASTDSNAYAEASRGF